MNALTFVVLLIIVSLSFLAASKWSMNNSPRYKLGDQAFEMIEECQATLPRNIFCTLYAKEITE